MPQEYVWSDMGCTHLKFMGQTPHQSVENVVGQWPQAEVGDDRLNHPWVSLRETLSLSASSANFLKMF